MATVEPSCWDRPDPAAVVFPGVGVKLCGKEPAFYERHRSTMAPFLAEASALCGVDLQAQLLQGTVSRLPDEKQQLFTFAFCAGAYRVLRKATTVAPVAAAGYSFGIYAALYACGSVSYTDGLSILQRAYALMAGASEDRDLGMGIVIGLEQGDLLGLLDERRHQLVSLVNTNHDTCFVFSGPRPALIDFLDRARAQDAFTADLLDVRIPYHHPVLLRSCMAPFAEYLHTLLWNEARFPLVSSIDQRFCTRVDDLIALTWKNLASPISWRQVVAGLHHAGVTRAFECGPGISLSQNSRFLPFDMVHLNVKKAVKCQRP